MTTKCIHVGMCLSVCLSVFAYRHTQRGQRTCRPPHLRQGFCCLMLGLVHQASWPLTFQRVPSPPSIYHRSAGFPNECCSSFLSGLWGSNWGHRACEARAFNWHLSSPTAKWSLKTHALCPAVDSPQRNPTASSEIPCLIMPRLFFFFKILFFYFSSILFTNYFLSSYRSSVYTLWLPV